MKIKTVKMIEVSEWDELVKTTYKRPYSFQQQDGCKDRGIYTFTVPIEHPEDFENETIPEVVNGEEMGVSFKAWLNRNPKQPLPNDDDKSDFCLSLFWDRNFYPHIDMIINDLYNKKLLKAGKYTINIDW